MPPIEDPERHFERLFRTHYPAVRAYVRRRATEERVDDIVAEVFLVAWRRRERVPDDPLPWLYAVGRRVLSSDARVARRRHSLWARLNAQPVVASDAGGEGPEAGDDGPLEAALAQLPAREREALMLIAWEGLTPAQAAAAIGDSPGTFRVRLHRARRRAERLLAAAETSSSPELTHDRSSH